MSVEPPYDAAIAVEGATDRFMGRPRTQNPYNPAVRPYEWALWAYGWTTADWLLTERAEREALRWLNDKDAA